MASRWLAGESGPWIMGVLNCTPDSFSDGGQHNSVDAAVAHGLRLHAEGAALIDVGGESTRPGSLPVPLDAELARTMPMIERLVAHGCVVSIDTSKAEVMRRAIQAGATMVNDVTALSGDPESLAMAAEGGVDVCLMHMRGTPATMQLAPHYDDPFSEVCAFFEARLEASLAAGIREESILLDPGIGFGKRLSDNLELIRRTADLRARFGMPVLLGLSRKSFLGAITGAEVAEREWESGAAHAVAAFLGADVLRVHDVAMQKRAMAVGAALRGR